MPSWQDKLAAQCSDADLAAFIDHLERKMKPGGMPDYVSENIGNEDFLRGLLRENYYGQPLVKEMARRLEAAADCEADAERMEALAKDLDEVAEERSGFSIALEKRNREFAEACEQISKHAVERGGLVDTISDLKEELRACRIDRERLSRQKDACCAEVQDLRTAKFHLERKLEEALRTPVDEDRHRAKIEVERQLRHSEEQVAELKETVARQAALLGDYKEYGESLRQRCKGLEDYKEYGESLLERCKGLEHENEWLMLRRGESATLREENEQLRAQMEERIVRAIDLQREVGELREMVDTLGAK